MGYPTTRNIAPAFACFFRKGVKYVNTALFLRHEDAFNRFFCKATPATQYNWILSPERERPAGARLFPPEGTPIPPIEPGGEYDPFRKDDEK